MKKELLKIIDDTIQTTCKYIRNTLNESSKDAETYYPNETIKALAELIIARALIEKNITTHSSSDSLSKE